METWRHADLHAYVDDCLAPEKRRAFETQMAQDPALARRAAAWRAQNIAIRSAFDVESARAFSIGAVRHPAEGPGKGRRSVPLSSRPPREPPALSTLRAMAKVSRLSAQVAAPSALRQARLWRLSLAAVSACLVFAWAPAATVIPARRLAASGVAAFRAFARPGVAPVELTPGDRAEWQEWLTTRLAHPVYLPPAPAALSLVGARIAPYPGAPAAFVVYRLQDRLVGLLVQSFDAPAPRAPRLLSADGGSAAVWTWRGQGLALTGDLDAASLQKIAADFFDPAEAVQTVPERGR